MSILYRGGARECPDTRRSCEAQERLSPTGTCSRWCVHGGVFTVVCRSPDVCVSLHVDVDDVVKLHTAVRLKARGGASVLRGVPYSVAVLSSHITVTHSLSHMHLKIVHLAPHDEEHFYTQQEQLSSNVE